MGFTGKQVIHPGQVPVVQEAFSPSPQQVEWAQGLIQAFHQHQASGKVRGAGKGEGVKEAIWGGERGWEGGGSEGGPI